MSGCFRTSNRNTCLHYMELADVNDDVREDFERYSMIVSAVTSLEI